ncbi:MAG: galactose-1-phosphate uridylyltransferase [Bacillota bacterium]
MSELRWDPVRREWTVTATHRMGRVFLPPRDFCPLCPTVPGGFETEIPRSYFEIAVFENRFPSFQTSPPPPGVEGIPLHPVKPAFGVCEVVVYTPDHEGSLATLPGERLIQLIRVWQDRYLEIGRRDQIEYVLIFENRGAEVGVTLHHPHGQIYGFSYLPPVPAREFASARRYRSDHGRCLFCDLVESEQQDGRRVIMEDAAFTAFIPFAARYPFEVHLYIRRHCASLLELTGLEISLLAASLQRLVKAFDRLLEAPFPYIMILHQEPTGKKEGLGHLHFEFYPPLRDRHKLKFLAGCEQGAGTFINDSMPEEKAAQLRKCLN